MGLDPAVRARLQLCYLESLPGRLERMVALRDPVATGEGAAYAEARAVGHQFSGMGGSFGYPELSERGRAVEIATDDQLVLTFDALIAAVQAAIEQAGLVPAQADEPA